MSVVFAINADIFRHNATLLKHMTLTGLPVGTEFPEWLDKSQKAAALRVSYEGARFKKHSPQEVEPDETNQQK